MPDESVAALLGKVIDTQGEIRGDIREIKVRLEDVADLKRRVAALELLRVRLAAVWAVAVVLGAALGWLISYLTGVHAR